MTDTKLDEAVTSNRYVNRTDWPDNYDYKRVKASRIVDIAKATGTLPPVALEIGVGRGGVAAAVSRQGVRVVGLDLSPDILSHARQHTQGQNVWLLRASGFALPLRDASLPLVYASQVLHLFDSPSRLVIMREACRVLQPGGRFVFDMKNVSTHVFRYLASSPSKRRRNYPSTREVLGLLEDAGFSPVHIFPGVLPLLGGVRVPNIGLLRGLTHTRFFVATRR